MYKSFTYTINCNMIERENRKERMDVQDRKAGKVKGIDVSNNNGSINWSKVKKDGYQFAYIKASEGTNFNDTLFDSNVKKAKASGIHTGAYHFGRPSGSPDDGDEDA